MSLIPFSDFQKKYKQKRRTGDKYRRALFELSFGADVIPEYYYDRGGVDEGASRFPRAKNLDSKDPVKANVSYSVRIQTSPKEAKKFRATILSHSTEKTRVVDFGQRGASDYTKHGDYERMVRYLTRHHAVFRSSSNLENVRSSRERWGIDGIYTAGFWSRWLLWSAPSLNGAKRKIIANFPGQIRFV